MLNIIKRIGSYCINIICGLIVIFLKGLQLVSGIFMFLVLSICGLLGFGTFLLFAVFLMYCIFIGITLL